MSPVKEKEVDLHAHIIKTICQKRLITPGDTVLVAVSGGADSVALLSLLHGVQSALQIQLAVAHYEHGIRGESSREDAHFVQALSAGYGIPCHIGHGDVPQMASQWRCSLEDAARRARYAFFDSTAKTIGADKIALAHQLEDQAETLLLHLVHGCGLQGLGGMRSAQGNRIRPLLDIPRSALESYLVRQNISWRQDETNEHTEYARNLLRHEVFPILCRLNPRVSEAMARTARLAADAVDTLNSTASALLTGRIKQMPYGAFWWMDDDPPDSPLRAYCLRLFVERFGIPTLSLEQTDAMATLGVGETMNLSGNWRACRTAARMHLLRPNPSTPSLQPSDFSWEEAAPGKVGDGIHTQALDAAALPGASFRFRLPGDVFAPLGGRGTQKLKETLQDAHIDRPFRDLLPVLAVQNRILWIVGLKPSRDAAISPATQSAITIRYHGLLPWEINASSDGGNIDAKSQNIPAL